MRLSFVLAAAVAAALAAWPLRAADPSVTYEAEAMASASSGAHTPFWLAAGRDDLGSVRTGTGYLRAAVFRQAPQQKGLTWGFGADLAGSWRAEAPFVVRQLYGELRYGAFLLSAGPRVMPDSAGFVDRRLSSGDLLFAGNALPVPEIRLSMPGYVDIPGLRHWLGVKAYLSYGRFTDGAWQRSFAADGNYRYTTDVLFHSKGISFRVGPQGSPFVFEGALDMAAQFGGRMMQGDSLIRVLPHRLKDYLKVLIPKGADSSAPLGEQTNVLGNHQGEWRARLRWQPAGRQWRIAAYYLHYFDDHSMIFFDYPWKDGLWGLEYRNPSGRWITGAAYEFVSTTDQSGPVYWDHTPSIPEQVSGRDDYYNHADIYNAWQHWGMGIANPLIIAPVYNPDGFIRFQCNRLRGHHWAVEGRPLDCLGYRLVCSYTRGWGTYQRPYREVKSGVSLLAEASWTPRRDAGWSAVLAVGADFGRLLGKNFGASLSIKKTGLLTNK